MAETIYLDLPAGKLKVGDARLKDRVLYVRLEGRGFNIVYVKSLFGVTGNKLVYHDLTEGSLTFSGGTEPITRTVTVLLKN